MFGPKDHHQFKMPKVHHRFQNHFIWTIYKEDKYEKGRRMAKLDSMHKEKMKEKNVNKACKAFFYAPAEEDSDIFFIGNK